MYFILYYDGTCQNLQENEEERKLVLEYMKVDIQEHVNCFLCEFNELQIVQQQCA